MGRKDIIPETYEQWRYCIEVLGENRLTNSYLDQRLSILENKNHEECRRFASIYGEEHLQRTVDWFRRAKCDLK